MKTLSLLLLLLLTQFSLLAQSTGSLQGSVVDAATQQSIASANIRILSTKLGAISNKMGQFNVKAVPTNSYSVQISFLGYSPVVMTDIVIRSGRVTFLTAELHQQIRSTEEVTVRAEYFSTTEAVPVSTTQFSAEEIRRAPGSAGDINRVLSSSPSVGRVDDSRADIAVRGGSPAENIFYVDNIPFININYFPKQGASGGPISFLNIAQVQRMSFLSGGFDATRNALSSVIDISLREPNTEQFTAQAELNMIGVGGSIECPLGSQSSMYFSVSRGYLDVLKDLLDQTGVPQWGNVQTKFNVKIGSSDRLAILGFSALSDFRRDSVEAVATNTSNNHNQQWQNIYGCNWQHIFGDMGFANTSLSFNSIHSFENARFPISDSLFFDNESSLKALHLRNVSHLILLPKLEADFGADIRLEWHALSSFAAPRNVVIVRNPYQYHELNVMHSDVFASFVSKHIDKLQICLGIRADNSSYGSNRSLKTVILPRASLLYAVSESISLSVAYGRYSQPLAAGLLQYSLENGFPTQPVQATHAVASFAWLVDDDTRFTLEAYDKHTSHLPLDVELPERSPIDAAIGDFDFMQTTQFRFDGTAHAYGIEASLQKKMSSNIYVMLGGSLSRSFYVDATGVERNRLFDNRFLLNATSGWRIDDEWELSAQVSLLGGNAYTPLDVSASQAKGVEVTAGPTMSAHLPIYRIVNLRVDKRFHFSNSNIIVYITLLNALNIQNVKNIEWNPYSKTVNETRHIGLLPILGVEWQL